MSAENKTIVPSAFKMFIDDIVSDLNCVASRAESIEDVSRQSKIKFDAQFIHSEIRNIQDKLGPFGQRAKERCDEHGVYRPPST